MITDSFSEEFDDNIWHLESRLPFLDLNHFEASLIWRLDTRNTPLGIMQIETQVMVIDREKFLQRMQCVIVECS